MNTALETARQDLTALETDAAELAALLEAQTQELTAMRGGKSRDYARVAELEGTRAALASLLGEQRAKIERARDHLALLQTQAERAAHIAQVAEVAGKIKTIRAELDSRFTRLVDMVTPELTALVDLHTRWGLLRGEWATLAGELGAELRVWGAQDALEALLPELQEAGIDTALLLSTRGHSERCKLDRPSAWPVTGEVTLASTFEERLPHLVLALTLRAIEAPNLVAEQENAHV